MTYAGGMKKRIAFQSESRVTDAIGGAAVSWATQTTVWGKLIPLRGAERIEGGRLASTDEFSLEVRSSSETRAVKPSWRAVIDGVNYQIRNITNPDQHNEKLVMTLERGVGQ